MTLLTLFFNAIRQVLLAGLVLGAGLPALFAVGMRTLAYGNGEGPGGGHHPLGVAASYVCFAFVFLFIALGITVILGSGFGFAVSFEHIYPTIVDK